MTDKTWLSRKKIWNYFWNILLVAVVLILLVPSWRVAFQGWWQSLFMRDVEFNTNFELPIPDEDQDWAIFNMKSELINFKDFSEKPVILSFWATWCPPCRAELPELKALHDLYKNKLNVVAVSEETIEKIQNSGLHEDYDFLYSTPGIPDFFEVSSYPTLLVIDSEMKIVFRSEGAGKMNSEKNHDFLEKLIRNE